MRELVDALGRTVTDLRVSVIDRCNLRCTYCMPADGLVWLPSEMLLTVEEIERVVSLFAGMGVNEVKLTGGEPTVRPDLPQIVRRLRLANPAVDLSITTNGFLLERLAVSLKEAGLDRVTVSCDSLLRHRFQEMTRRDALEKVLEGLRAAEAAGFERIKINCVVIAGTNEDESVAFASMARDTGYEVRFIEYMPLDADHAWERSKVVPSADLIARIAAAYPLTRLDEGPQPATTFRFTDGAPGGVGFISSVTEPFCDTCNRVRLTADGQLRACLFSLEETDLREPMRAGATDAD
ncbi:MAG: GTP 3',8-cyclase MoaA, partial [Actinobacteria bacterium]|nr:GTP 3',8-cyclase MoaA [Actinomycetota bacterium]